MRKSKSIVCFVITMALSMAFGSESLPDKDGIAFMSVIVPKDERTSVGLAPSAQDLAKRFALELDDNLIEKSFSGIKDPKNGAFFSQILGKVGPDTTFRVTYTYPDGNKVDVLRKLNASKKAEYPEFNFAPPVKFGDDNGPKNVFKIGLEVNPDTDPELGDPFIGALLGVGIVTTDEKIEDTENPLYAQEL